MCNFTVFQNQQNPLCVIKNSQMPCGVCSGRIVIYIVSYTERTESTKCIFWWILLVLQTITEITLHYALLISSDIHVPYA